MEYIYLSKRNNKYTSISTKINQQEVALHMQDKKKEWWFQVYTFFGCLLN